MYEYLPRTRTRRLLLSLAVMLLCLSSLPIDVLASTDIVPGQTAAVTDTGGDPINLRAKPHVASDILGTVTEGDLVEVVEGPIADAAGAWWYKVMVDGVRAYIAAEFLSLPGEASENGLPLGTVTATATIVNTGGDRINCRAGASAEYSVVATFNEGDQIELTGERQGPWQPVNCGGQGGFVHTDFVAFGMDETEVDADDGSEIAQARPGEIVNTGGDPINLRSKPRTTASVIGTVREGTNVTVLTGPITDATGMRWYKVIANGTRAYISADFVADSGNPAPSKPEPTAGTGVIAGTNGDGVRCRTKASTGGAVITVLAEGTRVVLRGAATKGWQPVTCAARKGYVSTDFIEIEDDGPAPTPTPDDDGDDVNHSFKAGDDVLVANTNGDGVRLRSKASSSASVITVLPEGQKLVVRSGSAGDWVAVTYRTSNGFVHMDYLNLVASTNPTPQPGGSLKTGDHAEVTDSLNFRDGPSFSSAIIATAPAGTVVLITGAIDNGFYPVEIAGFPGFLHSDYLVRTDKDLTDEGGDDGIGGDPGSDPATPQGAKMIKYAMKFLGYPYVWATHGPDTFDCSGFTYYVTVKTLKMDIGAGTWSQSVSGTPVQYGDLRPGDLVFFQNTFTWGLSHVGIYIGDGKFIHAENEQTGVVISSLTSTYYKTRWYGARRITTD